VATNATRLTKRTLDALEPRDKPFIAFDAEMKGFGVRVMPTGAKTFILEYRPGAGGRSVAKRRLTLGRYGGAMTLDQARKAAMTALARVRLGADPQAEKSRQRAALSVSDLIDAFLERHVGGKLKPKSQALPFAIGAIRILVLTGARLNEILHARWEHVDFERGIIFLPDSKTGRKPIFLSEPALAVLKDLPRIAGNPHVFPGKKDGKPRADLDRPWQAVTNAAGLDGLRIHDLRHSFASVAAGASLGLPVIGKLLGHSQAATTQRYAQLADDPMRAAVETIGETISAAESSQMDKSFHRTSEFEKLDEFQAFVSGQIGPWAELDRLVEQFVEDKIVIEKYRSTAIQRFSLAVSTSALTARSVYLTEKARSRGIAALKEDVKALDKAREILKRTSPLLLIPGGEGHSLEFRRHIEPIKLALNDAIAAAPAPSQLRARNFRNTDIYKHTFVQNLSVCWKKFTGKSPPRSDNGPFVEFIQASFLVVGIADNSDAGRYVKDVFTRKNIS